MSTMSFVVKLWSDSSARSYLKAKKSKALQSRHMANKGGTPLVFVKIKRRSGHWSYRFLR